MLNQFKWPYLNRLKIQIHQFLKWIDSDSDSQLFWIKTELIQFWIDSRLNLTNTGSINMCFKKALIQTYLKILILTF